MPTSSLRTAACSDNWGEHEWAKDEAYALALRTGQPADNKRGPSNARRIARQIERNRAKRLKANPEKCGIWPLVISLLISLISSMIQKLFTWWWEGRNKAGAATQTEWDREIAATQQFMTA